MMMFPPGVKVFIATHPIDMRKSHNGLAAIVQSTFKQDIFSGHLFVFFSRSCNKVKILYWDRNGYALWYKRLEKGRFGLPRVSGELFTINPQELCLLLEGIELTHKTRLRSL